MDGDLRWADLNLECHPHTPLYSHLSAASREPWIKRHSTIDEECRANVSGRPMQARRRTGDTARRYGRKGPTLSDFSACEKLENGGFLAHRNHQGAEMRQKSVHPESSSERIVKNIRRATRKRHSAEEEIRIVLDGLRGERALPRCVSVGHH